MTSPTIPRRRIRRLVAVGVAAATLAATVPVAAPADAFARAPHVSGPPNRVALVERSSTTAPSPTAAGVTGSLL
jgi:hypothetical protein